MRGMDTVGRRRALGGETPVRRSAARPRPRPAGGAELHTDMRGCRFVKRPADAKIHPGTAVGSGLRVTV
jgi:hypothetical protein